MADTDEDIEREENLPEDSEENEEKRNKATDENSASTQQKESMAIRRSSQGEQRVGDEESETFEANFDPFVEGKDEKDLEEEEEEEPIHFNTEDYISGPTRVENGTIPMDILELHHSYAYDCQRYFNLCVADPNTIIFASGNLINFFNVSENKIWFRRGSTGGGIGHITRNPTHSHIAIGENGIDPPIIIYEWPSMEIVTILKEGTTRSYSHLAYSPDGLLLASQGGDPDYLLTVWNWRRSRILLRCKSHGQDIYNVMFSPSVPGHLTSSGSGHIKFWKMARTFTGLKLKGDLGRFGKTEISDIVGVYPMPDEKVVSGCEWGNILLWDEGLIKLEVCRKNRKTCHAKLITQFEYNNGELMSVSMDGWIRIWFFETIDQADPPDEDRFIEIEPIYEFHITEGENDEEMDSSMLMCIHKQNPDDPEETSWYAQDGNGGLWLIDLCTSQSPKQPKKILTCHAGPITDMDAATWGPFVATFGRDAHLHIYNYHRKKLILVHKFRDVGSRVVWFPCSVEATGSTIVCAFGSGVVRMMTVAVIRANDANDIRGDYVRLLQVVKPHTMPITAMSLNNSNSLLVTGSEDATIFVFHIQPSDTYPKLLPIGYIKVPSGVSCLTWKPQYDTTILVGCMRGECVEVELPGGPVQYTSVTYELVQSEPRFFKFNSVKSSIRRELFRQAVEKKKEAKIARKRGEMEQLRVDNPGIEIDEEAFLMDSEEDPPLPEIYIPEVPNPVLMANYTAGGTVWLSMPGFDAGYIYEYPDPSPGKHMDDAPIRSTMVFDADDTEIRSCLYHKNGEYLFLGMEHGEIRICRVNPNDHTDFSDYWILPMHDNYNGYIPKILLSHDHKMLLTCGHDGNLFSFIIHGDAADFPIRIPTAKSSLPFPRSSVEDIEEPDHPSLEEVIVRTENDRIMAVAKQKKDHTLEVLRGLAEEYGKITDRNRSLLKSQQIPQEEFELDPRITADLNQQLKTEMDLVHRKLAFRVEKSRLGLQKLLDYFVEPITCLPFAVRRILKPDTKVLSLRELKLGDKFTAAYAEVERRIEERDKSGRVADVKAVEEEEEDEEQQQVQGMESFLKGLSPSTIQHRLGVKINQMLRKYRARKARQEERQKEWKAMYASKPDPNVNHPDDVIAIEHAKTTIGDYKLKISPNFSFPKEQRENTLTKYKEFLDCRRKAHNLREDFNTKLRAVRTKKEALIDEVANLVMTLKAIHSEIPEKMIKDLPTIPQFDYDLEFPERNLELEKYTSMAEQVKEARLKKKSFVMELVFNPTDEEHELLLMDDNTVNLEQDATFTSLLMPITEKMHKAQSLVQTDVLQILTTSDRIETPWEREMKRARVARKIYEQDCILKHISTSYEKLDQELDVLERERIEIVTESVYMDLFLLTLHQELIVLKEFEAKEEFLTEKVDGKIEERASAKQKVQSMSTKIEQRNRDITKLHEKIKDLISQYMTMINENKFHDFLRRIFKKKYKPPKAEDESSSSSSSSSDTSSDDDDAGSIDSRDIGPIHMDENICPPGCDRELYLSAFTMREKRYEHELQIREEQKSIENLRKEIENDTKKLKFIESNLKSCQDELEAFMQEKQRKLNSIDMTVILKLSQLQHFKDEVTTVRIRDCVVFDKTKLTRLYARVGELQQETLEQKMKHKKNRTHLHRMNVDCKHMEAQIRKLKDDIRQEMIQKFGQEVPLDALYEAVLRRMIYDIKANLTEMNKVFDAQIQCVKDEYAKQLNILKNLIQDNTEKLSFLTILEEEQAKLKKILKHKPMSEEDMLRIEKQYRGDLLKLENILKNQLEQKKLFEHEIKNLTLKSRPLPPICSKKNNSETKRMKRSKRKDEDMTLAVIDVETGEGIAIEQTRPSTSEEESEEYELAEEDEEAEAEEDKELEDVTQLANFKEDTVLMVRELLTRIIDESADDEESAEAGMKDILKEVVANLPVGGSREDLRAGIEKSVENILATLPQREDQENIQAMRQAIRDIINEIVFRLDTESKTVAAETDEAKNAISELLREAGLEERSETLKNSLLQLLHTEGVKAATDHLLANLPEDADGETRTAVHEHATAVFTEISMNMQPLSQQTMPLLEGIEESGSATGESSPDSQEL